MFEVEEFLKLKNYLFSIAYRITGSYQDSEDIIQEAYIRWSSVNFSEVNSIKSFLGSIVARLSLDLLKRAERRKESYIGPYLPEPIPEYPTSNIEEEIDFAFLVILEALSPIERAVFILREAFNYEYASISQIVEKSEENCRQIFKRSKEAIQKRKKKFQPDNKTKTKILNEFLFACYKQDPSTLSKILQEDIIVYSDGGGKVHAARIPILGIERVSAFVIKTSSNGSKKASIYLGFINGSEALIGYVEDKPSFVQILKISENKIARIYTIVNPEKLKAFQNKEKLLKEGILKKISKSKLLIQIFMPFL
jgi:RNA polymerase sigma-70 factor, ECF subfamily